MISKNCIKSDNISKKDLSKLSDYPLLDIEKLRKSINCNEILLRDILRVMAEDEIPGALDSLHKNRLKSDWSTIANIVHKIKGGAMYCATTKLKFACLLFEEDKCSGDEHLLDFLYDQLIYVSKETEEAIKLWLSNDLVK